MPYLANLSTNTLGNVVLLAFSVVVIAAYVVLFVVHISAILYARRRLFPLPSSDCGRNITCPAFYQPISSSGTSTVKSDDIETGIREMGADHDILSATVVLTDASTSSSSTSSSSTSSSSSLSSTVSSSVSSSATSHHHKSSSCCSNVTLSPSTAAQMQSKDFSVGVSIIKPVMGIDVNLEINLATFFTMNYPLYELLFCVPSDDDEALPIIRQLIELNPHIQCRVLTGLANVGVNPKINNMYKGYQLARYPLVLISDSGIFMRADTLTDMVYCMMHQEPNVGLVHQVPFMHHSSYADRPTRFAQLYQLVYFGGWHAKIYLSAACFGLNCTTGMSCLLRKHVLDEAGDGGLAVFGRYLAEDFFIARHFQASGWRCVISRQPAWQNSASDTVAQFQSRIMRWYQLRAKMVPHTVLLEPLSECFIPGLLVGWLCYLLLPQLINPAVFFLCHVLVWFLLDYSLLLAMLTTANSHQHHNHHDIYNSDYHSSGTTLNKTEFLAVWLFRESTSPFLQLRALMRRSVEWRNHKFRVRLGGITEELQEPAAIDNMAPTSLESTTSPVSGSTLSPVTTSTMNSTAATPAALSSVQSMSLSKYSAMKENSTPDLISLTDVDAHHQQQHQQSQLKKMQSSLTRQPSQRHHTQHHQHHRSLPSHTSLILTDNLP